MFAHLKRLLHPLLPVTSSLGIEITDTTIKLTEARRRGSGPVRIAACGSEPLPAHTMDDGRILDPIVVTRSLQTLAARLQLKTKSVHMVLPSQSIMVRFLKFPDIPLNDLKKLIAFEVKHSIHLPFDDPVYDFVKLNGTEERYGRRRRTKLKEDQNREQAESGFEAMSQAAASLEQEWDMGRAASLTGGGADSAPPPVKLECDVMLVAAPRALVNEYMSLVQAAGFKVKSLEIKALSLYRIIETARLAGPDSTFLLLDVNERAADLSIFHGGQLKITRSIPVSFGEKRSPAPLAEVDLLFGEFAISEEEADFNASSSDLAHELERLMNFYRYTLNNRSGHFEKLILSGDTPRLLELAEVLEERLQLNIELIRTDEMSVDDDAWVDRVPAMAVPIGLALRGNDW